MGNTIYLTACNICQQEKFEIFADIPQLKRRIVMCMNCGVMFVNPMNPLYLTIDFEGRRDREQKYRELRYAAEEEGRHNEDIIKREAIIRTLHFKNRKERIEHHVKNGKLLDIGCGRGFFLRNFVGTQFDYLGVEPRKRISEEAKKMIGEERVYCGTLKEANLASSQFDVVTMINVIEHLPYPRQDLEEVNRIMKCNGLLFIETPNVRSFVSRILGKRWHPFFEREHHYFFSKETLTMILSQTGFTVKEITRGSKLFSIRYLLYRLSWYNDKMSTAFQKILDRSSLSARAIRIPQSDELLVFAEKVRELEKASCIHKP